jgi:CRISPR system Cascade subunit CasD
MTGLLLRLAGLWSSYGTHAAFRYRTTAPHPTRSALIGMFAAAAGRSRETALAPHTHLPGAPRYTDLRLTIRIDRPGQAHTDYHTAGGGRPHKAGLRTSAGPYRPAEKSTHISHRCYLTGAVFTIAVRGPAPLLEDIAEHLNHPRFNPYLGRRVCLPDEPLVLGSPVNDPLAHLRRHVPLTTGQPPHPDQDTLPIDFLWEEPPPTTPALSQYEPIDEPIDLTPTQRSYLPRPLYRTTERLPAALYAGPQPLYALTDYILEGQHPC